MTTMWDRAKTIWWRLNEPVDENRFRPTKVHQLVTDNRTACGIHVPEFPYDQNYGEEVSCKLCIAVLRRDAVKESVS